VSPAAPRCRPVESCPACGDARRRERFSSPDRLLGVPGTFRYVECGACRTVFQDPRVRDEDLPLCYEGDYYTHDTRWTPTPAPPGSPRDRLRRAIRHAAEGNAGGRQPLPFRFLGALLALHPGLRRRARFGLVDGLELPAEGNGRCLEVGPGAGVDLLCLRLLGWEACGLEADPRAADTARRTSGCEVRLGTLETTDYPAGSFDLVYLSHVFEHLPEPSRALARCLELLVPGGRLVLVYPNPSALTTRCYGVLSLAWDPPRHLVLPPASATLALLSRAGFQGGRASTLARTAAASAEAAGRRRRGAAFRLDAPPRPGASARVFAAVESLLVALGRPVGEEIVASARRPQASA
jgi:SAM-dependent methyltransferase